MLVTLLGALTLSIQGPRPKCNCSRRMRRPPRSRCGNTVAETRRATLLKRRCEVVIPFVSFFEGSWDDDHVAQLYFAYIHLPSTLERGRIAKSLARFRRYSGASILAM